MPGPRNRGEAQEVRMGSKRFFEIVCVIARGTSRVKHDAVEALSVFARDLEGAAGTSFDLQNVPNEVVHQLEAFMRQGAQAQ